MTTRPLFRAGLDLLAVFAVPQAAWSSSTWLLEYTGVPFGNTARAQGTISFVGSLPNPSDETLLLPGSEVSAFSLTVSNATHGNGTFDLSDFDYFSWNTKGVELDVSRELIGQITVNGLYWASEEGAGGFGLGAISGSGAPTSLQWYVLATNEGIQNASDPLALSSFRPAPVPLPSSVWLLGSALCSFMAWSAGSRSFNPEKAVGGV